RYDTDMLGIEARAARWAWTVALVALGLVSVYLIRRTLLIFVAAMLVAYLLAPLVGLVDRLTPRRLPKVASLAVVYVVLLTLVGAGAAAIGNRVYQEASQLASSIPAWLQGADPLADLPVPAWMESWKQKVIPTLRDEIEANAQQLVPVVGEIGKGLLALLGNVAFLVLVPILSFLFLKDAHRIREKILEELAGSPRRRVVEDVLGDVNVLLGQFMRALVILAAATLVFYGVFFLAVGLPYAALLATLAGALEFMPVVGPLSAGVVIVLVAILSGHAHLAIWLIVFMLAYRLFQDYVLQPYLMSKGVELHPLWIIFGVLAGEQIGGVPGMFLSIPVLATLRVVYVRILKARAAPA
ncbi:MAG TPA: AI-2E family transporter, partial [Bryobacteraceae bacterium]|nr:AI-2E family transporter [Bryobacteraceae bacterium]